MKTDKELDALSDATIASIIKMEVPEEQLLKFFIGALAKVCLTND